MRPVKCCIQQLEFVAKLIWPMVAFTYHIWLWSGPYLVGSLHLFVFQFYVVICFCFVGKQECSVCINVIIACVFLPYLVVEWSIAVCKSKHVSLFFCVTLQFLWQLKSVTLVSKSRTTHGKPSLSVAVILLPCLVKKCHIASSVPGNSYRWHKVCFLGNWECERIVFFVCWRIRRDRLNLPISNLCQHAKTKDSYMWFLIPRSLNNYHIPWNLLE